MENELLRYLLSLTLASSVGILAVFATRRPARHIFGSSACYSLWLLVPIAVLGALLPQAGSSVSVNWRIESVAALGHALGPPSLTTGPSLLTAASIDWQALALGVWCTGVALFAAYVALQQHAFVKSLGCLSGTRCVLRAARADGCPALLGIFRPKIILPADFKTRYTRLERLLIFSHERTHLRRGDAACNGVVVLMRCIFWFNPLVHLASSYFRLDQEFACDAAVMWDYPASRRTYAGAMLKTELADLALPVGCHWRSAQGLKARVWMLRRRMPNRERRLCGGALTAILLLVVGCTTWVAHPQVSNPKPSSAIAPTQSGVTGPIGIAADEATVSRDGRQWELQGNARLILPPGVKMQVSAGAVSAINPKTQTLEGDVHLTIGGTAHGGAAGMILHTDSAIVSHQSDGSVVVQFDEGTVQQLGAAGDLTAPLALPASKTPHLLTPNFKDADLAQVAKAVGLATRRSFIIDPHAHAQITMASSQPMTPEAFYQAFLATLQAHGLAALPAVDSNPMRQRARDSNPMQQRQIAVPGDVIWIVPAENGR